MAMYVTMISINNAEQKYLVEILANHGMETGLEIYSHMKRQYLILVMWGFD